MKTTKKQLISYSNIQENLKKMGYKYYSDSKCRIKPLSWFVPIFVEYHDFCDNFSWSVKDDKLTATGIAGFSITWPLHKEFVVGEL